MFNFNLLGVTLNEAIVVFQAYVEKMNKMRPTEFYTEKLNLDSLSNLNSALIYQFIADIMTLA